MTRHNLFVIAFMSLLIGSLSIRCNSDKAPVTPEPEPYDSSKPTIQSFIAKRGTTDIKDGIVYSGEDINLAVSAVSHAFPVSCGLGENDVVEGNLMYGFTSEPPSGVPAPGAITQGTPPSSQALWRVPNLDAYDSGGGILFNLKVKVSDQCLGNYSTGSITIRAFANQGTPRVTNTVVQSSINTGSPVTEEIDANGFYEIEKSDECHISVTAESRTLPSICTNRGINEGDELKYSWSSTDPTIELSAGFDPTQAKMVDFTVPVSISVGTKFSINCRIEDACTGTVSNAEYKLLIVGAPEITSLTGTANGAGLVFDPYFDNYEVQPGDKIILTATGDIMDDTLCDSKGINPDLMWGWKELSGTKPAINPEYETLPFQNSVSTIEFVIPVVSNGTKYSFEAKVTDRCNLLTDSMKANFVVIVGPVASVTYVKSGSETITPSPENGRYEIHANDTVEIRITADAASESAFCTQRGISLSPPVQYSWSNPGNALVLNYPVTPDTLFSDLIFVVPFDAPHYEVDMHCVVTDLCNGLTTELTLPFKVIE
jgi:hypothetical protein